MLSMIGTGNMKILKKLDGGMGSDNQAWAHFAAISCEEYVGENEKKNDFYILKAFGSMAQYIERNLNEPRRAQIVGELKLEKYTKDLVIKKEVPIGNDSYDISFTTQVETQRAVVHNVSMCKFFDKKREKEMTNPKEDTVVITKK